MGKISKLMKLLSASAVVAGANSVALADCGLCGDKTDDHKVSACPHFDYRSYGLSKGYKPETLPDNDFLGKLALADRKNADAFLNAPKSTVVSFATPTDGTSVSAPSLDNSWSNTETTTQSSNEKSGASDKLNALKFERTQDLSDSATAVSESDTAETAAALKKMEREEAARSEAESEHQAKVRAERLAERRRNKGRANFHEERNRAEDLQNLFDEENARKAEAPYIQAKQERARVRDGKELKDMMADSLAKNREDRRNARELRAKDTHLQAHLKRRERELREQLEQEEAAANKIQNAARARLARKKAAELKAEAERQGKIQEHRENAAARKLTEALRKNKERKQAERQAQIAGDYELAKKLQAEYNAEDAQIRADRKLAKKLQAEYDAEDRQIRADRKLAKKLQAEYNAEDAQIRADRKLAKKLQAEYDAEDRQIRADRLLAEQEQLRENLAAVPVEEARNGADFEYRSEQDQINADNLLAQQEQAREYLGMNAQEPSNATATREVVVADEENETDRWTLPQATAWNFQGFDFESNHRSADRWAKQLDALSVRKIECVMWLISTSYQQLQNAGNYAPTAQMAEALSDVDNIFPYSGTNSGIMNVYNAFKNTDTADFVQDLERLGKSKLDGILWYVSNRYMHLLLPGNGKKAASAKFIELAKATLEHFGTVWEADEAQVFGEENETPGVDNTEPAVVNENRREPQVSATAEVRGIVETERAEDTEWNIPYVLHEVLKWPLGSYKGGDNRRVYLGKFNEALQDLGIRRLEVVMYLAASSYQFNKVQGRGALGEQSLKLAKDIYNNILPAASENKANARLVNWHHALENMHDERLYFGKLDHYGRYSFENNDMNTYDASFQGAFRRITAGEQEVVLGKIATLYREKLREGKHPSSMLFVDFADEICKELNLDGFFGGEDTEEDHPAWDKVNKRPMWEFRKEFESEAKKPATALDAAGNPAVVAENHQEPADIGAREPESDWEPTEWKLPEDVCNSLEFRSEGYYSNPDRETSNEGQARERLQKQISALNVRQLEALLGLASSAYTQKLEGGYGARPISNKIAQQAKDIFQLIVRARHGENEHLLNVLETVNKADGRGDFQRDVKRLPARQIEAFIAMIAEVYDDKVDEGAVPAAPEFKKFSHDILKLMYLKYYDEEETPAEDEATNDSRRNALEGDNGVLIDPARA